MLALQASTSLTNKWTGSTRCGLYLEVHNTAHPPMHGCGGRSECSHTTIKYKDRLEPVTSASTHGTHAITTLPHSSAQLCALLVTRSSLSVCAYSELSLVLSSRHCWGQWFQRTRAGSQECGTAPPHPQRTAEGQTCARTEMADYHTRAQGRGIRAVSPTNALHRHKMQHYMDYTTWCLFLSLPPSFPLLPSPPLPYFSNGITDSCSRSLTILFSSEGFRFTLTTGL